MKERVNLKAKRPFYGTKSRDPDQTPYTVASDQGLHGKFKECSMNTNTTNPPKIGNGLIPLKSMVNSFFDLKEIKKREMHGLGFIAFSCIGCFLKL